jgi:hypothetical protein
MALLPTRVPCQRFLETSGRVRPSAAATALTGATTALVGAVMAQAAPPSALAGNAADTAAALAAQGLTREWVPAQERQLGIDALLAQETARMRESLASAALGSDHSMLLARKRSTDWAFLAAAVTARIGAGSADPRTLLASIITCEASVQRPPGAPDDARPHRPSWPRRAAREGPLVADAVTCMAEPAGSDFPCAIGWRIVHDAQGLTARALWHEPMVGLRGFDAPLVPDRTTIRLDADGCDVECWGFGRLRDPWPDAPAPLDQLGDAYDFADAARHWWWSDSALDAGDDAEGNPHFITLPECDVIRVSPWLVGSSHEVDDERGLRGKVTGESARGSIAVPLRPRPSHLHVRAAAAGTRSLESLMVSWIEQGRCRGAARWTLARGSGQTTRDSLGSPSHGWIDAQARLQLLQHSPTPTLLPQPYGNELILGERIDESAAHARATANVWQAALVGDCAALARALFVADSLRLRRGLPRSFDAMALAALAESLLARGAPERSIITVVVRHLLVATALPPDQAAAHAEFGQHDLMPPISRQEYAAMLSIQGRRWAAMHCGSVPSGGGSAAESDQWARNAVLDPIAVRFDEWHQLHHLPVVDGSAAPAAIHARILATSSADGRSPSGGIASSSSIGSVSTVSSELASGSPGFTIVRPRRSLPMSVAGSSSRMPAFDFPRPWQSKQRASKNGSRSVYATASMVAGETAAGAGGAAEASVDSATIPDEELSAADGPCDARSALHNARVT